MRALPAVILTASLALSATTAQAARVSVDVLHPADIDLPADLRRVAVVDRSGASNAGQAVLGTLEAAVTGEGIRGDRDAARRAVQTMTDALRASPRFEVVGINPSRKALKASLWDKALTAEDARALCRGTCDLIVSLEAFDTDSGDQEVMRTSVSVATWRVYDGNTGALLDSERMHAGGRTASVGGTLMDMALNNELASDIGEGTALAYAARIAPTWQRASRRLLGTSGGLRAGIRLAKVGDWAGAVASWEHIAATESGRRRSKALFNLAVAAEASGDLGTAVALASDAHAGLGRRASRELAVRLRTRAADDTRLHTQLTAR